jgi:hypothetical protein
MENDPRNMNRRNAAARSGLTPLMMFGIAAVLVVLSLYMFGAFGPNNTPVATTNPATTNSPTTPTNTPTAPTTTPNTPTTR